MGSARTSLPIAISPQPGTSRQVEAQDTVTDLPENFSTPPKSLPKKLSRPKGVKIKKKLFWIMTPI